MVGAVIGSYQLVRKLGEGGMGAVYLARHTLLGRRAAIKVLLPALSGRPEIVNRFFNEARAATSISDPGIVQVFDFGYHTDGSAFIVMEFLEGEALDRRLAKLRRFSPHEALRLARQLATSLAAAHAQHIIHRDLKPENVFLVRDAEVASGWRSKILDFGIAKLSDDHPGKIKTHTGALMGTPVYMSPEQCRGVAEIDHRSDIYALGCVLFHLVTGRPPFTGEGVGDIISAHIRESAPVPSSIAVGIPASVDALVLRCLAKSPADRFATMTELAAAIGILLPQVPDTVLQYAGPEAGTAATMAPTYHSQLPATEPPAAATSVMPTTIGATNGQVTSSARPLRIGRWIAAVLVIGALGAGMAILRGGGRGEVAALRRDAGSVAMSSSASREVTAPPGPATATETHVAGSNVSTAAPSAVARPAETRGVRADAAVAGQGAGPVADTAVDPESRKARGAARPIMPAPIPTAETGTKPPRSRDRVHEPSVSSATTLPSAANGSAQPVPVGSSAAPAATHVTLAPPTSPPPRCSKADFAAVYDAAVPVPGAVRAALRNLKLCRDAGAITEAEFDRYQTALVARL